MKVQGDKLELQKPSSPLYIKCHRNWKTTQPKGGLLSLLSGFSYFKTDYTPLITSPPYTQIIFDLTLCLDLDIYTTKQIVPLPKISCWFYYWWYSYLSEFWRFLNLKCVYATAEILQFPRQLNPSILTGAGLGPKFIRTQPPPLRVDDGASNNGEKG